MKKIAIYCRISTDKQEANNQLIQLREFCKKSNYEIYNENQAPGEDRNPKEIITDNDMSEERDPNRASEDRDGKDLSDEEREIVEKKKLREENRSKAPSEERAPEMISDNDNDLSYQSSEDRRVEDIRDREQEEKKKMKEEKGQRGPSQRRSARRSRRPRQCAMVESISAVMTDTSTFLGRAAMHGCRRMTSPCGRSEAR